MESEVFRTTGGIWVMLPLDQTDNGKELRFENRCSGMRSLQDYGRRSAGSAKIQRRISVGI